MGITDCYGGLGAARTKDPDNFNLCHLYDPEEHLDGTLGRLAYTTGGHQVYIISSTKVPDL